jgi:drug/metabolite transporter (DMT)-like permease
MDRSRLLPILLSVVGISGGQLLLKLAAMRMQASSAQAGLQFLNIYFLAGVAVLGLSTLLWTWQLRSTALNEAYPFMALCFVLVPIGCYVLLGEPFSWRQAAGTLLIVAGVIVVSR